MSELPGHPPRLGDVGEEGLLDQLFPLLRDSADVLLGAGDDAAVVRAGDGRFVVTTDVLVQDVDFRLDWSSGGDVGWKAAMQNLADVAAMGARPTALVVALMAPSDLPVAWAVQLTRELVAGAAEFGAGLVGGDLSSGPAIAVSVTAFGDLGGRPPVRRSGALPGDVVALAGETGWSAAGLDLLLAGHHAPPAQATEQVAKALARHRRPRPLVPAGVTAALAGATAMIDTSDGLLRDLGRVARASGVRIELDPDSAGLAGGRAALRPVAELLGQPVTAADGWVLSGGEDHALAACFPAGAVPAPFVPIGRVSQVAAGGQPGVDVPGVELPRIGFDHFHE